MNICEKHSMTMIEIGCEKCIEEIVANARNEGFNQAIEKVLNWWRRHHPEDYPSIITKSIEALKMEEE